MDLKYEIIDLIEDLSGACRVFWEDEDQLKKNIKELIDGFMERIYNEKDR